MPQVHGACRDAVAYAEWLLKLELNAVTDNPLIFIGENDPDKIDVISGGNFHGEPLALAFDYLAMALAELGNISERRTMRLTDENSNAHVLPAFLTEHGGLNSGFMIVQYTAAALCTENKILSHPASVDTIPSSANVEDHVSMGLTAALKLRRVAENLASIIALELFCAAQGIDLRRKRIGEKQLGRGTRELYDKIRRAVPFVERDEYLKDHIDRVREIVDEFEL
jgi:histidine ammonia-lyase